MIRITKWLWLLAGVILGAAGVAVLMLDAHTSMEMINVRDNVHRKHRILFDLQNGDVQRAKERLASQNVHDAATLQHSQIPTIPVLSRKVKAKCLEEMREDASQFKIPYSELVTNSSIFMNDGIEILSVPTAEE